MDLYAENILDHYKNPRNKGKLKDATVSKEGANPLCGDQITMYLEIRNNRIKKITFDGIGCAISQAAASMLTEELTGKTLDKARKITKEDMLKLLGVDIGPTRLKCALLALSTLQEALRSVET